MAGSHEPAAEVPQGPEDLRSAINAIGVEILQLVESEDDLFVPAARNGKTNIDAEVGHHAVEIITVDPEGPSCGQPGPARRPGRDSPGR